MGGGGGGGSTFSRKSPDELQKLIRSAELNAAEAEFGPQLAKRLNDLLSRVNDRNENATTKRLNEIKSVLRNELEDSFDLRFGGSVAKHTFVDGLSDVDTLLVFQYQDRLPDPKALLTELAARLGENLPQDIQISKGRIAITLRYSDGEEIQVIAAVRDGGRLHVPAWETDAWSRIDPEKFRKGLTKRNEECGMKLVPTIKLAKAVNATLPEPIQLSGYHIEAMALTAFKTYQGPHVVEKMLPYFFKSMSELVQTPIRDSTGQSVHVDEYLGRSNSAQRQQVRHILDRIARRMENATAARSLSQWGAILGE